MATIWVVLHLPGYSLMNALVAAWVSRNYWLATALFGAVYAGARVWQRVAGERITQLPARPPLTGDARRADIARGIMAWYMVGGCITLVVFSLADRGPFAWATEGLRPMLGAATPLAGFVLGAATFVLSLWGLRRIPCPPGWPMLAAAQAMAGHAPPRSAARRPHRSHDRP